MTFLGLVLLLGVLGVTTHATLNLRRFRRAPRSSPPDAPAVSVVIPARNEQDNIDDAVRAACGQTHDVEVIVLDDGSTDSTRAILARLEITQPRLRVVTGDPLPEGWAGKAWACWQLASRHARHPWVMFVDCDVRLMPDAVERALGAAHGEQAQLISGFPRYVTRTVAEALVVPLIHLVLLAYLPLRLVRRVPTPSLSAGCGQLMLVQRSAYLHAGGHRAVRATLHDGIKLARLMKAAGFAIAVFDASDVAMCRMYAGLAATWSGFTRNAYEALGSPAALVTMILLNVGLFVMPFVALPYALVNGGSPWLVMTAGTSAALVVAIRLRLAWRFGAPRWTALATPVAVALMVAIQVHSFINHCLGRHVSWRARAYHT